MPLDVYTVDAFSPTVFGGNPAAVVPLEQWLPDATMQQIAAEHNLSETAFFVPQQDAFHIRWFTPVYEVDLCGHATLATSHVLFEELGYAKESIEFHCLKGRLDVQKTDEGYAMDFPADEMQPLSEAEKQAISEAIQTPIIDGVQGSFDALVQIDSEDRLRKLSPDMYALTDMPYRGVLVTTRSSEYDFVSRCFFPRYGIPEDPVTGSAHTLLTPYWHKIMGKNVFEAKQISARGGVLRCTLKDDRIILGGQAVTYAKGQIRL